jgi:transposase
MVHRVQVRAIDNDEGNRLLRIVRRSSGSVVTWRRAQMVLLSAQGMDVPMIAKVTFTSPDRVRDVIHNFNADGFDSLQPKYAGGRPPKFTLTQRQDIKKAALSRPTDHGLPFSTWSLSKLADFRRRGGGRRHLPRGPANAAARGGRLLSRPSRPGRPAPTLTTRPRRTGCWSSTPSPTGTASPARATRP